MILLAQKKTGNMTQAAGNETDATGLKTFRLIIKSG
jgi:hypothetical protein